LRATCAGCTTACAVRSNDAVLCMCACAPLTCVAGAATRAGCCAGVRVCCQRHNAAVACADGPPLLRGVHVYGSQNPRSWWPPRGCTGLGGQPRKPVYVNHRGVSCSQPALCDITAHHRSCYSDRAFTDFLIDASVAASRMCDGRAARPRPRCLCCLWSHRATAVQGWQRARTSIKYQRFQCYQHELPVPPAWPARRARHRSRHHWAAE
jgi:hypothetical protein